MNKRMLNQFFNIQSFKNFADSAKRGGFEDTAGILIKENLKHIDPQIFEKKYPELSFLNSGIAADNSGGYSETIQSLRLLPQGDFKVTGDKSSDKGQISMAGETSLIQVTSKEAESKWSDTELEQAKIQGVNLQQKFLEAHTTIYQREVDKIIALGVAGKTGSVGLMNNSFFATGTASGAIGTLTGVQKYEEIAAVITDQHNQVFNTPQYMANAVMMPVLVYNAIARDILNSAGSEMTVLAALKKNFPEISFYASVRADKVCAYSTSEQSLKIRIPLALTVSPIVPQGFKYCVESKYRIAGLDVLEKTAGRYLTGL